MKSQYDRAGYNYHEVLRFVILYQSNKNCRKLCPEGRSRCPPWVLLLGIENKRDQKPFSSFLKAFTVRDEHNFKQTVTDKAREMLAV